MLISSISSISFLFTKLEYLKFKTKNKISNINFINDEIKKEYGSKKYSIKEIKDNIKNIVERRMIKEVIGQKLSKFVYNQ